MYFHHSFHHYFANKNYIALYINNAFYSMANAITLIFGSTYLFSQGMPLHFVLLFLGVELGMRGVLSPLGVIFPHKMGVKWSFACSYTSVVIALLLLSRAGDSLIVGFSSFIFLSFAKAIQNTVGNALHTKFIHDEDRGRSLSIEIVLVSLASLVGIGVGTWFLVSFSFLYVAYFAAAVLFVSLLPVLFVLEPAEQSRRITYVDSVQYVFSKEFKPDIVPYFGYALAIMANVFVAPLFVFVLVGDFEVYGPLMGLVVVVETMFLLAFGGLIDKNNKQALRFSSGLHYVGNSLFLLFVTNPLALFAIQGYNRISWHLFYSSFHTKICRKAHKTSNPFLYAVGLSMVLCFTEVVVLSIYALIAYFFGMFVFAVVFLLSLLGAYLCVKYFREEVAAAEKV